MAKVASKSFSVQTASKSVESFTIDSSKIPHSSTNVTAVNVKDALEEMASQLAVSTTAPTANVTEGDLWYDTDDNKLYVRVDSAWKNIPIADLLDQNDFSSDSDTAVATQQSIKAYVASQLSDLAISADSGSNIAIVLASEVLAVSGGEGIDTSITGNAITIAGEDATTSNKGVASFSSDNFAVSSGAVTIKDDGVILGTETSGNYVGTIVGGTGVDSSGATSGEGIAHTLSLDLNELATETAIADGDFIPMVDISESNASNKITFENLEDAIFSSVSGDIAIAEDGAATIQANSVALTTDTTGNYMVDVSAGTLIDVSHSAGEGSTATVNVNLTEAGEAVIANGDYILFLDGGATGTHAKESLADLATLFAGTGLTSSSSVLNVIGGTGITANANEITTTDSEIVHDNLSGFVANEHIDHSGVTLTAGVGLSGGGTIASNRTFTVDLNELPTETTLAQDDFIPMVDTNDSSASNKITFSNLEDEIFGNVSGDATIAAGGALTIASTSVEGSMLNTNVISGQTEMTGDVADADELMVSDGGTVKRADFSVVRDAVFGDVSGDIVIADGGAATIQANSVALGNDTTGNYVATIAGTSNEVTVSGSGSETAGVTIGLPDDVTIAGDLTVNGDTVTVNTATLSVEDPLIILASGNNSADSVDIGFYGLYDTSGSQDLYAGIFRDANDSGKFKLFKDLQAAPSSTVNTSGTGYATATLVANIEGNVTGDVTGNVTGNASGTAATVTGAAQTNITSLGTLSTLTVDSIIIDGANIGHTSDTDSMAIAANGVVTFSQIPVLPANTIDSDHYVDASIDTAHIEDNQITLAKMAGIARGKIIYGDASGDPAVLTVGNANYVLTSNGTDISWASTGSMSSFQLEDDDGTEVAISEAKEVKFIGSGITTNWTNTSNGTDADPYDLTFTINAAQTGITSLLATDIKIGEDDETKIDFETANEIHFFANNTEQVYLADNIFGPQSDSDVDLGTTGVRWKDAFVDSITVTGEVDGASLDIEGDADINGTTNLDVVDIDGAVDCDGAWSQGAAFTVGANDQGYDVIFYGDTASANMTWDTSVDDLILNGAARVVVPEGQLVLGSTAIDSTATELNYCDGVTSNIQTQLNTKGTVADATALAIALG